MEDNSLSSFYQGVTVSTSSSIFGNTFVDGMIAFNSYPDVGESSMWQYNGTAWLDGPLIPV